MKTTGGVPATVQIGRKYVKVASFKEAKSIFLQAYDNCRGSEMPFNAGLIRDKDKMPFAMISQNGRIWLGVEEFETNHWRMIDSLDTEVIILN